MNCAWGGIRLHHGRRHRQSRGNPAAQSHGAERLAGLPKEGDQRQPMVLVWIRILLGLAGTVAAAEPDPYADIARRLSVAARDGRIQSLVISPLKAVGESDDVGSRLLTERLSARFATKEGMEILDSAQLKEGGGGSRRAPDDPFAPELDIQLFDGIMRVIQIADMHLEDTAREAEIRTLVALKVKERQLAAIDRREKEKARREDRTPEADAIVSGVFAELKDGTVEVHARLANARSFAIIATASARVRKDWGAPQPALPRDYFGLTALTGTSVVGLWFLLRATSG